MSLHTNISRCDKIFAYLTCRLALKDQEFQMLQAELETRTKELSESTELLNQQVNKKLKTTQR